MRVAFVVKDFPVVSEPFIVNQIADLTDRSVTVDVFAFQSGDPSRAVERYHTYRIKERTHIPVMPKGRFLRFFRAALIFLTLVVYRPSVLVRAGALGIANLMTFPGEIPFEEAHAVLENFHIYIQSSKTAPDGNME